MPISGGLYGAANSLARGLTGAAENIGHGLVTAGTNAINRTGEAVYDAGQAIDQWVHPPQAPVDTFAQRGYPAYMRGKSNYNNQWTLGNYAPQTLPQTLPTISAYRADPTGKYGGKEGIETQPTMFDPQMDAAGWRATKPGGPLVTVGGSPATLYAYARELGRAQQYGVPQLSAQQLAALALKEGRADYGSNGADMTQASNKALQQKLYPHTNDNFVSQQVQSFPVLVAEKMAVAKRLGIPFAEAWNGTGSQGQPGQPTTGRDYARGYDYALQAAAHPKNKPLVDFIQSALDAGRNDK